MLVIALVCASAQRAEPRSRITAESEVCETTLPSSTASRKRTGKPNSTTRHAAHGATYVVAASVIDLVPPRVWIVQEIVVAESRAHRVVVAATARAPPA